MTATGCQASWMTRDELLELLVRLRCAPVGRARLRAPHKPLLLLWLFGRFAASGSTVTAYAEAEESLPASVARLIVERLVRAATGGKRAPRARCAVARISS